MQTLTHRDLAGVTGGAAPTTSPQDTTNDQLLTAIQGIQSDIKDLGKNQGGLFGNGNTSALMFMTMALAMQRREVVVYAGRRWHHW